VTAAVAIRGGAIAVTQAVEAFQAGDIEYARELVGIADAYLARALVALDPADDVIRQAPCPPPPLPPRDPQAAHDALVRINRRLGIRPPLHPDQLEGRRAA
jgi:hypothetical protein